MVNFEVSEEENIQLALLETAIHAAVADGSGGKAWKVENICDQ